MHSALALMKPLFGSVTEEEARASINRYEDSLLLPENRADAVDADLRFDFDSLPTSSTVAR